MSGSSNGSSAAIGVLFRVFCVLGSSFPMLILLGPSWVLARSNIYNISSLPPGNS
ncbi:hypothetical protein CY34DRAFT_799163 [Suillus luteus UH-Slu-Lm8-n1]|uniref:Uncharacterized protein n=1 Tax=Suillus luteus UH-Slu-Lm8-n1 TaxID=930992 RepID=A0A0D0B108_9AGAM|nr:hypothetical protein CY34DRAFT_799163 [Suillus luteus UH-Slu-Lm8-n1]